MFHSYVSLPKGKGAKPLVTNSSSSTTTKKNDDYNHDNDPKNDVNFHMYLYH